MQRAQTVPISFQVQYRAVLTRSEISSWNPPPILQKNLLIRVTGNKIVLGPTPWGLRHSDSISQTRIQLQGHTNRVTCIVTFGQTLVSGQAAAPGEKLYDSPLLVWDLETGKCKLKLDGLKEGVKRIAVSEDGALLCACSEKYQVMLWRTSNWQSIWVKNFENPVDILCLRSTEILIHNNKLLASYSLSQLLAQNKPPPSTNYTLPSTGLPRNYICFCEVTTGPHRYLLGTEGGQICFFDKGIFKWMEIVGKAKVNSILLWRPDTLLVIVDIQLVKYRLTEKALQEVARINVESPIALVSDRKAPDQLLLQAKNFLYILNPDSMLLTPVDSAHASRISGLSARKGILASIDVLGFTIVRSGSESGVKLENIHKAGKEGRCISLHPTGLVLNGYADGSMRAITSSNEGLLKFQINAHKQGVSTISCANRYILTGGEDCVVRIWALSANESGCSLVHQLSVHQKRVSRVLPDQEFEHIIHSASMDKSIHSYNLKTDKKLIFRQAEYGSVTDIGLSGSTSLVSCGVGAALDIWEGTSVTPILHYQVAKTTTSIRANCLAINQSFIAVGFETGHIGLFSLNGKEYKGCWMAHSREVTAIQFFIGDSLFSVSDDSALLQWKL